ncbi:MULTISPECIES: GrpB family protein [Rhizobium]|uniref:GrpB family protein n=1 Tax=Rhizobium TaxID=379 RepID=UPI00040609BE|nr:MULTISPECIES: GrpB family protein [Rhizobium]
MLFRSTNRRATNAHVCEKARFNRLYPLLCRDFLRTDRIAGNACGVIKQRLAERFPTDEDAYYDIKTPSSIL